jgi:hypothetical protein
MAAAAMAPLAAAFPQHTQRLPLVRLPQPSPPTGLGLGAPWQSGDNVTAMLETLRPAWWYDWRFEQTGAPGYVPMIWSSSVWHENDAVLTSLFERRPDTFWLLWNEPERSDQANMQPDEAATLTAEIAAHGIQYAAPGVSLNGDGYLWLEDYLRHGGPVPHCWHVHMYGSRTPAEWSLRWASWVVWMREHCVVRPTIVSETNGWTEGDYGQCAVLDHVAAMLDKEELLQAAAWFATRWDAWATGHPHLMDESGNLTTVGDTFAHLRTSHIEAGKL